MAWLIVSLLLIITIASVFVCTMATTIGWTTNGKFDTKGWFDEFKSFLIPLWLVAIAIFILTPYIFL